jgi:RNA polymerase sigma factor for flagellar operon FliA
LVGDGCVGLIRAVDAFDPQRGVPIKYYARSVIVGAMLNGIRQRDPVSERVRRRLRQAESERFALAQRNGTMPALAEMEQRLPGLAVARRIAHAAAPLSLDSKLAQDEGGLLDYSADPARLVLKRSMEVAVRAAVSQLPERERRVVLLHYFANQPLSTISRNMRISPQRASQLHLAAVKKLRTGFQVAP